jgi:hypothetical protein
MAFQPTAMQLNAHMAATHTNQNAIARTPALRIFIQSYTFRRLLLSLR